MDSLALNSMFDKAYQKHQENDLNSAKQLYLEVLKQDPNHALCLHHLGVISFTEQDLNTAKEYLERAIVIDKSNANFFNSLGNVYLELAEYNKAKINFKQALNLKHKDAAILNNLAFAYQKMRSYDTAIKYFQDAIKLQPKFVIAHNNLANTYFLKHNYNKAIATYKNVISLDKNHIEANINLAKIYSKKNKPQKAINLLESFGQSNNDVNLLLADLYKETNNYQQALNIYETLYPYLKENYIFLHNLGYVYNNLKEYDNAIKVFIEATDIEPNNPAAYTNLSLAYKGIYQLNEALKIAKKANDLSPNNAIAKLNLGTIFHEMKNYKQAVNYYKQALEINPNLLLAYLNLGHLYREHNELEAAKLCLEKIVFAKGQDGYSNTYANACVVYYYVLRKLCHWEKLSAISSKIIDITNYQLKHNIKTSLSPLISFLLNPNLDMQREIAKSTANAIKLSPSNYACDWQNNKITIGYITADFDEHAVALLISDTIKAHDNNKFEIKLFATNCDKVNEKLSEYKFFSLSNLNSYQAADIINQNQIDILVDLNGHTKDNRLDILKLHPAKVQCSYLGYPDTLACDYIENYIGYDYCFDEKLKQHFTENLALLPQSLIAITPYDILPSKTKSNYNLPLDGFILAVINNPYRIDQRTFNLWLDILKENDNTYLWLPGKDTLVEKNLSTYAINRGVTQNRLIFRTAEKLSETAYTKHADLILDTTTLSGGTGNILALNFKTPVITLMGDAMWQRTGAGIVNAAGLSELIVTDLVQYKQLTSKLINDKEFYQKIKSKLDNVDATALFNVKDFVVSLEKIYQQLLNTL